MDYLMYKSSFFIQRNVYCADDEGGGRGIAYGSYVV